MAEFISSMQVGWTVADARRHGACYDDAQLTALWAGRDVLTPEDIAALEIPANDRVWALSRMLAGTAAGAVATERIVRRAVERYALPHPSTTKWASRWLDGTDRTEAAAAAWADARAAALAAASDAAWAAAWADARAAEASQQVADYLDAWREGR